MDNQKRLVMLAILMLGYWLGSGGSVVPSPEPTPSRPVLRWLAGVARNLLWTAAFLEPPPKESQQRLDHAAVVHSPPAEVGEDGAPVVNHVRGF